VVFAGRGRRTRTDGRRRRARRRDSVRTGACRRAEDDDRRLYRGGSALDVATALLAVRIGDPTGDRVTEVSADCPVDLSWASAAATLRSALVLARGFGGSIRLCWCDRE